MKYIFLVLIMFIGLVCREKEIEKVNKPETKSVKEEEKIRTGVSKLSNEDVYAVKQLLQKHVTVYDVEKPDNNGIPENYAEDGDSIRLDPFDGRRIPILRSFEVLQTYEAIDDNGRIYYEFTIQAEIYGCVNITKKILEKKNATYKYKFGMKKYGSVWKIYLEGNGPYSVPIEIMIKHYQLKKNAKMVNELELWGRELGIL